MQITKDNLPSLLNTAFTGADYGSVSLKELVDATEIDTDPMYVVRHDDYVTKTIVNALLYQVNHRDAGTVQDAVDDLNYAIKQLQIARDSLKNVHLISQ